MFNLTDKQTEQQTIIPLDVVKKLRAQKRKASGHLPKNADILTLIKRLKIDDAVPLYVATVEGELVYVNESYQDLVQVCHNNRSKNSKLPSSLTAIVNEVQLSRQTATIEEEISIDNVARRFRSRHFPICDDDGRVIAVGGTYVDCTPKETRISQAALTQERFRDFARATSDWYWEVNADYQLTYVSERLSVVLGAPAFMLKGKKFEDFGKLRAGLNKGTVTSESFLDQVKPFRDQLFIMNDHDNQPVYIHLSGVPLFDAETGNFEGFRGAGMDVTANYKTQIEKLAVQKSLENTLEELTNKNVQLDLASAEAEAALGAKSEFLAAMSHELRTPLNAIIGFAEAMKMEVFGPLNDQYVSYSNDIMTAGKHLLELINDVLDVAVLESGKLKLDCQSTSLAEIMEKALNLVILRADGKDLDTSDVLLKNDFQVNVDDRRVTQIFVNLLSNAVKFTPEHGKVGVRVFSSDHNMVGITVWDTGIGIPKDQQELVFEKFHQATGHIYSRKEEGTGLGLHISRQLARQMGGNIELKSVLNEGSEFTVYLPLA